ncbi:MAG: hypothetical protein JXA60_07995 [Candidatus Coatesbacteria bacterium]|nr:hypothetical protein [Candidatus Coatesbacteria bacterium]
MKKCFLIFFSIIYIVFFSCSDDVTNDDNTGTGTGTSTGYNKPPSLTIKKPSGENDIAFAKYTISWAYWDLDSSDTLKLNLYYDTDRDYSSFSGIIAENIDPKDGSYIWSLENVALGDYYILGVITDKQNIVRAYSEGYLTLTDDPRPLIEVTKPDSAGASASDFYTIEWVSKSPAGSSLKFDLYYDTDTTSSNGVIGTIAENLPDSTYYKWDVSDVHSGTYYIKITAKDTLGNSVYDYSEGAIRVGQF